LFATVGYTATTNLNFIIPSPSWVFGVLLGVLSALFHRYVNAKTLRSNVHKDYSEGLMSRSLPIPQTTSLLYPTICALYYASLYFQNATMSAYVILTACIFASTFVHAIDAADASSTLVWLCGLLRLRNNPSGFVRLMCGALISTAVTRKPNNIILTSGLSPNAPKNTVYHNSCPEKDLVEDGMKEELYNLGARYLKINHNGGLLTANEPDIVSKGYHKIHYMRGLFPLHNITVYDTTAGHGGMSQYLSMQAGVQRVIAYCRRDHITSPATWRHGNKTKVTRVIGEVDLDRLDTIPLHPVMPDAMYLFDSGESHNNPQTESLTTNKNIRGALHVMRKGARQCILKVFGYCVSNKQYVDTLLSEFTCILHRSPFAKVGTREYYIIAKQGGGSQVSGNHISHWIRHHIDYRLHSYAKPKVVALTTPRSDINPVEVKAPVRGGELCGEKITVPTIAFNNIPVIGKIMKPLQGYKANTTKFHKEAESVAQVLGVNRHSTSTRMTATHEDAMLLQMRNKMDIKKHHLGNRDINELLSTFLEIVNPNLKDKFEPWTYDQLIESNQLNLKSTGGHLDKYHSMREAINDPAFRESVERTYTDIANGVRPYDFHYSLKPKNEKKRDTKSTTPRARPIQYGNLAWRCAVMMIIGPVIHHHVNVEKAYLFSNTGNGPFAASNLRGARYAKKGYRHFTQDVSAWDTHVQGPLKECFEASAIEYYFKPEYKKIAYNSVFLESSPPVVMPCGNIITPDMRLSGTPYTSFCNGLLNATLITMVTARITNINVKDLIRPIEDQKCDHSAAEKYHWNRALKKRIYLGFSLLMAQIEGDDAQVSLHQDIAQEYAISAEQQFSRLGFPMKAHIVSKPQPGRLDFCSHYCFPVYNMAHGRYWMPMRPVVEVLEKFIIDRHPERSDYINDVASSYITLYWCCRRLRAILIPFINHWHPTDTQDAESLRNTEFQSSPQHTISNEVWGFYVDTTYDWMSQNDESYCMRQLPYHEEHTAKGLYREITRCYPRPLHADWHNGLETTYGMRIMTRVKKARTLIYSIANRVHLL
jgi:hypothetical protein